MSHADLLREWYYEVWENGNTDAIDQYKPWLKGLFRKCRSVRMISGIWSWPFATSLATFRSTCPKSSKTAIGYPPSFTCAQRAPIMVPRFKPPAASWGGLKTGAWLKRITSSISSHSSNSSASSRKTHCLCV